jgi:hypothetical protein
MADHGSEKIGAFIWGVVIAFVVIYFFCNGFWVERTGETRIDDCRQIIYIDRKHNHEDFFNYWDRFDSFVCNNDKCVHVDVKGSACLTAYVYFKQKDGLTTFERIEKRLGI